MAVRESEAPPRAPGESPGGSGRGAPDTAARRSAELAAPLDRRRRGPGRVIRWLAGFLVVCLLIAAAVYGGYLYWYENTYFVTTENAQVTGDLVQVGSLNAGRIVATQVEVGDPVQRDQEIAVVSIPQQITTGTSGALRLEETTAQATYVSVRAPFKGVVVARLGNVGGTVSPGQPIYLLVDASKVWIRANIEETRLARVHPGQPAEVQLDAVGRTYAGRVLAITPASAATFSLLPSQNTSGNFVKVTQLVPVKIAVDPEGSVLPIGTSATVRIRVREIGGGLPWQP